jgi:hypothetical protein
MTGLICSKGGGGERCVEIRNIEVPDLWHIAIHRGLDDADEKMILEAWHLAHDMKVGLQVLDKVLPKMLGRATDRLKEYITDIQEMGDIEQRTVDNLEQWAEELAEFVGIFSHFPMGGDFMGSERNDAKVYIGEATKLAKEIQKEVEIDKPKESDMRHINHYNCPCGEEWTMVWTAACNDKCPVCNLEIEPTVSTEVTP